MQEFITKDSLLKLGINLEGQDVDSLLAHLNDTLEERVGSEITDSLDLHAFDPKDIKAVTIAYLAEAKGKGFRIVRLIHGKGIGVQREIVRGVLQETDFVKSFRSGDEFSGGWGATIAELDVG